MNEKHQNILLTIFLGAFIYFPLFWNLTEPPIPMYDESIYAINAYEMSQNGNYIVTHFNHKPDMWNTKPPLMTWLQVICIKTFGFNELSIRLPSALAGLFICLLILWFSIKHLKNKWIGILSIMVLVTTQGFVRSHVTRTGDYDALLSLFMVSYSLFFYCYLKTNKQKYFISFFCCLILSTLTKGIAGLLFLPALFIASIYTKRFLNIVKNKKTYIGIIAFLCFVLGFYLLREHYNPGYIKAVIENELGSRFLNTIEGHSGSFWFYCNARELLYWMYFLLPSVVILLMIRQNQIKSAAIFSLIISVSHFLILSSGDTKLDWYMAPNYPYLALLIGSFLFYFIKWFSSFAKSNGKVRHISAIILLTTAIFFYPYYMILDKVSDRYLKIRPDSAVQMACFLQKVQQRNINLSGYKMVKETYSPNIDAYMIKLSANNMPIKYGNKYNLQTGDQVLFWEKEITRYLQKYHITKTILVEGNVQLHQIVGRKE